MTDNEKKKVSEMIEGDIQAIVKRAQTSLAELGDIENDEQMNIVQNSRNYIKRVLARIDELYDKIIQKNREALETARQKKASLADPLKEIDRAFGTKLSLYLTVKIKAKEEEEERLRKEREKERRELEKKVEKAAKLENEGRVTQAQAVFQEVEEIEEKIKEKSPFSAKAPIIEHGHFREVWEAEIYNETIIPRKYWKLDLVLIERTIRAQKDKARIPGVKAVKRIIPVSKRS